MTTELFKILTLSFVAMVVTNTQAQSIWKDVYKDSFNRVVVQGS